MATLVGAVLILWAQIAAADHIAREDPAEPIFTERAFIENALEFDVGLDRDRDADTFEFSPGVTWIFLERLHGLTVFESLDDVGIQVQLAYDQELRPSQESREAPPGNGSTTEKRVLCHERAALGSSEKHRGWSGEAGRPRGAPAARAGSNHPGPGPRSKPGRGPPPGREGARGPVTQ